MGVGRSISFLTLGRVRLGYIGYWVLLVRQSLGAECIGPERIKPRDRGIYCSKGTLRKSTGYFVIYTCAEVKVHQARDKGWET